MPSTYPCSEAIELYQRYLEVREMGTDEVITIVELLSPTNKRAKDGRADYEKKRRLILASQTHLVELDLLRGAKPMAMHGAQSDATYRILVSRSEQRPIAALHEDVLADLYAVMLDQPLPDIPIPLKPGEPEPVLALHASGGDFQIVSPCCERGVDQICKRPRIRRSRDHCQ